MRRDRRRTRLDAAIERIRALDPGVSPIPVAVAALATAFDADHAGAYCLEPSADGRLHMSYFVDALGNSGTFFDDYAALIEASPAGWSTYDPLAVAPEVRNRARRIDPGAVTALATRHPPLGTVLERCPWLVHEHHLRVLLCDGPAALAWVGLLRERPFTRAEEQAFQPAADALLSALLLHRQLARGLATGALEAALEAVGGPAFLTRGGEVVHANRAGKDLLSRAPEALERLLQAEIEGRGPHTMDVTRLPGASTPDHYLLVARPAAADPDARLDRFARQHGLSGRQREVLQLVVQGEANKAIAAKLDCAESTVELHVTSLLSRTGCASRAALVARFWSERAA